MQLGQTDLAGGGAHGWRPATDRHAGLTVTACREVPGLERTVELDVSTPSISPNAVHGPHRVRITLPQSYHDDPTARFPVLYLLHGGDGGSSLQWSTGGGEVERFTAGHDVITVMPDGGKVGWYVDWSDAANGPQSWERYHLRELLPWVDLNLRTVPERDARGIAGISMGGFGAVRYAQVRPDLFSSVVSLSGALTLSHPLVRATTIQQSFVNGLGRSGPFGSNRSSSATWDRHDPLRHVEALRGTHLVLHSGAGKPWKDPIEWVVAAATRKLHDALEAAAVEHRYWTPQHPPRPGSQHSFWFWNEAMAELMGEIAAELGPARAQTEGSGSTPPQGSDGGVRVESDEPTGQHDR